MKYVMCIGKIKRGIITDIDINPEAIHKARVEITKKARETWANRNLHLPRLNGGNHVPDGNS